MNATSRIVDAPLHSTLGWPRMVLAILALSVAGGSIYLIPYIRYVFYDLQLGVMHVSNTKLALLTTAYAVGCIVLYIPGGILADRLDVKKCIIVSLLGTTALTVIYAAVPANYVIALVVWFLFALSTAFVFWGALFKTLRMISGSNDQGFFLGLYYLGNGLTGAAVNAVALWASDSGATKSGRFFIAVLVYAASTLLAVILVWVFVPGGRRERAAAKPDQFSVRQLRAVLTRSSIWMFALIVFCAYAVFSSLSYFTPYLTGVMGVGQGEAGLTAVLRYAFLAAAPLSGLVADRVLKSTSKWFVILFLLLAVLFAGVLLLPQDGGGFAVLYVQVPTLLGVALYGVQFAIAAEAGIPVSIMATAVGFVSMIGYLPDFFLPALFGNWLDQFGDGGYQSIFAFLAVTCVAGAVFSGVLRRQSAARPQQARVGGFGETDGPGRQG